MIRPIQCSCVITSFHLLWDEAMCECVLADSKDETDCATDIHGYSGGGGQQVQLRTEVRQKGGSGDGSHLVRGSTRFANE
jgi:hypothetical protein